MANHSPTPWHEAETVSFYIHDADHHPILHAHAANFSTRQQRYNDAAFVVKAANAYGQLEEFVAAVRGWLRDEEADTNSFPWEQLSAAEEALR